ncbi:hypothetical protein ER308_20605 [Egibacter rhizosphaerae]|uniref:DUF559 domain-containing protein n=1 Tax=Egibacter rhizosphaerae TaxID=1670831 RepID=A0A411YKL3_9ACTN|nr:hypothetical protein [Egibacter rhizosphaerae]QBI21726.1 hypothetical protein ER308_20605 [Egibacter rhizosphaerae]
MRALADAHEIVALRKGVWRFLSAPGEPDEAMTACLASWPLAVLSHASAARHHGLERVPRPAQPSVTVPVQARCRPSGVRVHRSRALPARDVARSGRIPVTSLARTVCDLADGAAPWETFARVDDAIALGASRRWLHERASALRSGRDGVALVATATAPESGEVFRSWLERVASVVYRAAGLPDPEWNVPIDDERGLIGIVDAFWRPWAVIGEKEGLRFHSSREQLQQDAQRFNRLHEAGYVVRRFGWEDVVHRPVEVAASVMRALRAAGADLDPARLPRVIELPAHPFR